MIFVGRRRLVGMSLAWKVVGSPVGDLKLVASDVGLVANLWAEDNPRRVPLVGLVEDREHAVLLDWHKKLIHLRRTEHALLDSRLESVNSRFDEKAG